MRAIAIAAVLFLVAVSVGYGSSGSAKAPGHASTRYRYQYVWQAASRLSTGCARRDKWWSAYHHLVFARGGADPLVYYADGDFIASSRGDRFSHVGSFPFLWPCRTPVAIYQTRRGWVMTLLSSKPAQRKTILLGRLSRFSRWEIAPNGRFLFFHGQTIQYAGGKPFTPSGLPRGWKISGLNPSPRNPSVFVANVLSPKECSGLTNVFSAAYLISSGESTKLRGWGNVCPDGVDTPYWASDGWGMVWRFPTYDGTDEAHVYLSDAHGRHLRKLLSRACREGLLYSPNGQEIAYQNTCTPDKQGVYVLDLTSGDRHFVADGKLEGWSPDGSELALLQGYYCHEAGSIVIVPAAGGTGRSVITWPASC